MVEKLTATGDFANAEHVELTNIGTAANALVASNASEIDAYSLVTDFAGGTVSVDEAIAILAAENANAVTGKNSFTLKIQDDNAKIKSAINDSDGLAALQAADEVLAVGASASDTVAVVDSGSAANSYGALVDKVTVIDFGSNPNFTVEEYLALRSASVTTRLVRGRWCGMRLTSSSQRRGSFKRQMFMR